MSYELLGRVVHLVWLQNEKQESAAHDPRVGVAGSRMQTGTSRFRVFGSSLVLVMC